MMKTQTLMQEIKEKDSLIAALKQANADRLAIMTKYQDENLDLKKRIEVLEAGVDAPELCEKLR